MDCGACGGANRDGARFCTFCGGPLALRCQACGADVPSGGRFCDACGSPVDSTPHAQPVAAARKVVTVLFADLTGSTALEERIDAESARSIVDRFNTALRKDVEDHGGRVVKFTGDGLMAAFGVATVLEDDADRAIACAVTMRATCSTLADEAGEALALKVGVNTGEVVVISEDDDVVGDAVNVASRLEGAASANEVLVGEETWRLTRATTRYEAVEPLVLKGKSEPVRAYRLVAVEEASDLSTPFIGRENELAQMLAVFEEAVAARAGRLVTIVGSPGLGKTRLSREFMSRVESRARVRETRCDPGGSTTFAPMAEALRGAAGIAESATEQEVIDALLALTQPDDPDRVRIATRAAAILGAGEPGTTEEIFWALRRLVENAAYEAPVVLVLDDVHWAEPVLLDLIEHMTEWIRDRPVLLVVTGRPELRELRPSFVEGGRASAVIALEGLDERETARLALGLLGTEDVPEELLAKIPASTQGNPLFVRELVRMLVDDGVLRRDGDRWSVTVDVDAIEVPPTIQSLLSARVDRLQPDERLVVELASVIGKEFYRGALSELAPPAVRERLDGCLESLRRKEFVEPAGTYWIDEPVYRFHHALIRDAAYRRLLKETRAELHERVSVWFEMKTAGVLGDHEETIAYHLEQAHDYTRQLGRPDDALGYRAAVLLGPAARRALDRDDLPAAAALSGRALDRLALKDADRPGLLLVRCEALLSMGDVSNGAAAVSELELVADDARLRAWATCFAAQLANLTSSRRLQETESAVAAAAAALTGLGDQAGAAKAHNVHATTLAGLGRFAECEAALDEALTAARAAGDNRRITATLGSAPPAALWGPNPVSRAGGRCLDIVRLLRITTGSPAVEAGSRRCQAVLEAFRGRAEAARRMLRGARRTLTELGLQHELLETDLSAGIIELVAGDAAAAIEHLTVAHEGFRAMGVDVLAAQSASFLARAHLVLDEDAEAEAFVATSEALASEDLKTAIAWRSARAELLARRGVFDEAIPLAEAAVELASPTDALIDHGYALRSLATVRSLAGDPSGARSAEAQAVELFERKGATALTGAETREVEERTIPIPAGTEEEPLVLRTLYRWGAMIVDPTHAGLDELIADYATFEDRRQGLVSYHRGRDAARQHVSVLGDFSLTAFDMIEVKGDRLVLVRVVLSADQFAIPLLSLNEIDGAGRIIAIVLFDDDDVEAAKAELDARYQMNLHVDTDTLATRVLRDFFLASNRRDMDRIALLLANDATFEDRRVGFRDHGRGADFITMQAEALYAIGVESIMPNSIEVRGDHLYLARLLLKGSAFEAEVISVSEVAPDGRFASTVVFDQDAIDDARAELDRRFIVQGGRGGLENEAFGVLLEVAATMFTGDVDLLDALVTHDFVLEDRRKGLGLTVGADDMERYANAVVSVGTRHVDAVCVAVRGDRLALAHAFIRGSDEGAFEIEMLAVAESRDGRLCRAFHLDVDDLDAALAELDRLFAAQQDGAPENEASRLLQRWAQIAATGDFENLAPYVDADFTIDDRRGGLRISDTGAEFAEQFVRGVYEIGVRRFDVRCIAVRGDRLAVAHATFGGVGDDAFDAEAWILGESDGAGRLHYAAAFDVSDLDEAIAELDRRHLAVERADVFEHDSTGVPRMENLAARVNENYLQSIRARDFDATARLLTEDIVWDDRRPGLKAHMAGRDTFVDNLRAILAVGAERVACDAVAIRGDLLALVSVVIDASSDGSFSVEALGIVEVTPGGLIAGNVMFAPEDLSAALTELDERFLAGEGAPYAEVLRAQRVFLQSFNTGDWEGMRASMTDDVALVDHRPASLGEMTGPDAVVSTQQAMKELGPDLVMRAVSHADLSSSCSLGIAAVAGNLPDGTPVELPFIGLVACRAGLLANLEIYPVEALEAARSRFKELATPELRPWNMAARQFDHVNRTYADRDWDAFRGLLSEDLVVEDRRRGLASRGHGPDGVISNFQTLVDLGFTISAETVAVRGERLVLFRSLLEDEEHNLIAVLSVFGIDEAGLCESVAYFDEDNLGDAITELDERYAAGEGAAHREIFMGLSRAAAARTARDWDAFQSLFTEDVTVVDHRSASFGAFRGTATLVELYEAFDDLTSDSHTYIGAVRRLAEDHLLADVMVRARGESGEQIDVSTIVLLERRGRLFSRVEYFGFEDLASAIAVFDTASVPIENEAVRVWYAVFRAIGDEAELRRIIASDVIGDDRRRGLASSGRGLDSFLKNFSALHDIGLRPVSSDVVAQRGDSHALVRSTFSTDENFDAEVLVVVELNELGLLGHYVVMDLRDIDETRAELDRMSFTRQI